MTRIDTNVDGVLDGTDCEKDVKATDTRNTDVSSDDNKEWDVESIYSVTSKVAQLQIESGVWSCGYVSCHDEDNDYVNLLEMQNEVSLHCCASLPMYHYSYQRTTKRSLYVNHVWKYHMNSGKNVH